MMPSDHERVYRRNYVNTNIDLRHYLGSFNCSIKERTFQNKVVHLPTCFKRQTAAHFANFLAGTSESFCSDVRRFYRHPGGQDYGFNHGGDITNEF